MLSCFLFNRQMGNSVSEWGQASNSKGNLQQTVFDAYNLLTPFILSIWAKDTIFHLNVWLLNSIRIIMSVFQKGDLSTQQPVTL